MGVGRNLSYRKSLFLRNKGFSSINHIPSGDDDLFINKTATKKNTAVVLDPESITLSTPKRKLGEWLRQRTRHYTTARYYKMKHKILLGLYFATQFAFYPLLAVSAIFYSWQLTIALFAFRFLVSVQPSGSTPDLDNLSRTTVHPYMDDFKIINMDHLS